MESRPLLLKAALIHLLHCSMMYVAVCYLFHVHYLLHIDVSADPVGPLPGHTLLFVWCPGGTISHVRGCMQVPEVDECVQAIVNIVPLQLLSYHLTLLRGHNVDQPRNLAKAVTVSEEG